MEDIAVIWQNKVKSKRGKTDENRELQSQVLGYFKNL
jgi:hypothetical protein